MARARSSGSGGDRPLTRGPGSHAPTPRGARAAAWRNASGLGGHVVSATPGCPRRPGQEGPASNREVGSAIGTNRIGRDRQP
eukprot:9501138-Pyramimonas_sp.AAC.1